MGYTGRESCGAGGNIIGKHGHDIVKIVLKGIRAKKR
jgi:hypothetical protein